MADDPNEKWCLGVLRLRGKKVELGDDIELFKPYIVEVNGGKKDGEYRLFSSAYTKFEEANVEIDLDEAIDRISQKVSILTLGSLKRRKIVVVRGFIASISKSGIMLLDDELLDVNGNGRGIFCTVDDLSMLYNEDGTLKYMQYSTAYVVGELRSWESATGTKFRLETWGIYIPEEFGVE